MHIQDASGIFHIASPNPTQTSTPAEFIAILWATYHSYRYPRNGVHPVNCALTEFLGPRRLDTHHAIFLADGARSPLGPQARPRLLQRRDDGFTVRARGRRQSIPFLRRPTIRHRSHDGSRVTAVPRSDMIVTCCRRARDFARGTVNTNDAGLNLGRFMRRYQHGRIVALARGAILLSF